jgi:hypothetical protein
MANSDEFINRFFERRKQGVPVGEAWEVSRFELSLSNWPKDWGDYLHVSLYGGIQIDHDIEIPSLGIYVNSEMQTGDFVFGAPFCYDCRIKVKTKTIDGFWDAIGRLELFLNSYSIVSLLSGSSPTLGAGDSIHYYSGFISSSSIAQRSVEQYVEKVLNVLSNLEKFPPKQHQILMRAMWWLRQARHDILSGNSNPSVFALYLSYWNAFECLISVICDIFPMAKFSKSQKKEKVSEFFRNLAEEPTPADIVNCYHEIINPGIGERAKHALISVLKPEIAEQFYQDCFTCVPEDQRLYKIRNDIDHGNIVEYDFPTRIRVINGLNKLQSILILLVDILVIRK